MGYDSDLTGSLEVKQDKLNEFKEEVRLLKGMANPPWWTNYFLDDMKIDEDGIIEYDDYYGTWYESSEWAKWIKDYIRDTEIVFIGEDSERWGFKFENGRCFELVFQAEKGRELI